MRRAELLINNTQVDLTEDISLPFTYQISDVREPESIKGSYSKTITIPASKENNKLFSHIYQISGYTRSSIVNFDPDFNVNKKADARVLIDGVEVFNGYCQLMKINKVDNVVDSYEIVIFNNVLQLFSDIGKDTLNGLDFSEFDHTLNYNNITLSQRGGIYVNGVYKYNEVGAGGMVYGVTYTPFGYGYVYPNIDYKQSPNVRWVMNRMYPAIYLKQYIDKIFDTYGYTYESSLFDSQFFKQWILPCNLPYVQTIDEVRNGTQLNLDSSVNSAVVEGFTQPTLTYTTVAGLDGTAGTFKFRDVNIDANGYYDINSGVWKAKYKANLFLNELTINCRPFLYFEDAIAGQNITPGAALFEVRLSIFKKSFATGVTTEVEFVLDNPVITPPTTASTAANPTYGDIVTLTNAGVADYFSVSQNDEVWIGVNFKASIDEIILDSSGEPVKYFVGMDYDYPTGLPAASQVLDWTVSTVSSGINTEYDQTVLISNYIPNYEIREFLNDLIRCFNLHIEADKNVPKKLIIEPYNDFYAGSTIKDWTQKVDISKAIEILPMGELDAKKYKWTFNEDKDILNEDYQNRFKATYGSLERVVDNDFLQNDKEVKVSIAGSPLYKSSTPGALPVTVLGHTYPDRIETKPRFLYYDWLPHTSNIEYVVFAGSTLIINTGVNAGLENYYGQALEQDRVVSPTFIGRFETVTKALYYSTSALTNANFYTRYWRKYIQEITDVDSKIVKLYVRLQATDLQDFSFRDTIYIDGNYYIVNKIIDYDPLAVDTTQIELLKLKIYAPSIETSIDVTPTVQTFNLVEGGENEVRDLGATSYYNLIEGGLNEVRDLGFTSIINLINGGENIV